MVGREELGLEVKPIACPSAVTVPYGRRYADSSFVIETAGDIQQVSPSQGWHLRHLSSGSDRAGANPAQF